MSAPKHGSTTVWYRQQVGRRTSHAAIAVYVSREAVLNSDLSEIATRQLRSIDVIVRDGYDDALTCNLPPGDALKLYHALGDALIATDSIERQEPTT